MGLKAHQSVGGGDFWLCKAAEGKAFQLGVAALVPKSFYGFYECALFHSSGKHSRFGMVIPQGSADTEVTVLVLENYSIGNECGQPEEHGWESWCCFLRVVVGSLAVSVL